MFITYLTFLLFMWYLFVYLFVNNFWAFGTFVISALFRSHFFCSSSCTKEGNSSCSVESHGEELTWQSKQTAKNVAFLRLQNTHQPPPKRGRSWEAREAKLKGATEKPSKSTAWRNRSCKHFGKFGASANQTTNQTAKNSTNFLKMPQILFFSTAKWHFFLMPWSKPIHRQFILIMWSSVSSSKGTRFFLSR